MTTPSNTSAAEQTQAARIGGILFRNRSWLPVPFLLVALLVPAHPGIRHWIAAAVIIAIGEWIRLAGVEPETEQTFLPASASGPVIVDAVGTSRSWPAT